VEGEEWFRGQAGCAFVVRNEPDQPMGFFQSRFHASAATKPEMEEEQERSNFSFTVNWAFVPIGTSNLLNLLYRSLKKSCSPQKCGAK